MEGLKSKLDVQKQSLVMLMETREITPKLVDLFEDCEYLLSQYLEFNVNIKNKDISIMKIVISILNSILYQKRIYFCTSRESMEKLVKEDVNWTTDIGWSDNYYSEVIRFLTYKKAPMLKNIKYKGYNKRKPIMFEVVDKDLLKMLVIDPKAQKKESMQYVNRAKQKKLPKNLQFTQVKINDEWKDLSYIIMTDSLKKNTKLVKEINKIDIEIKATIDKKHTYNCNSPEFDKIQKDEDKLSSLLEFKIEQNKKQYYYDNLAYYDGLEHREWSAAQRKKEQEDKKT